MNQSALIPGYRILREIGRGGMGIVYEASDLTLGRHVALKVLPGLSAGQPEALARFQREAASAARLSHHSIVQVYEAKSVGDVHYIAMEFVDGQNLGEWLLGNRLEDNPTRAHVASDTLVPQEATFHLDFPSSDSLAADDDPAHAVPTSSPRGTTERVSVRSLKPFLEIIIEAAEGLEAAHQSGVLHRDIKPGNLLLTRSGHVKIADFGLARSSDSHRLTRTGEVMGTPSYVSPEQLQGAPVDARSDLYSLGITLYEGLTGRLPFEADSLQVLLHRILIQEPPRLRKFAKDLPRDLETICLKAIEKEPERRYASCREFADDLLRFLANEPIKAVPAGPLTRVLKLVRRRRLVSALTALLLLGSVATWWIVQESHSQTALAREKDQELRSLRANELMEEGVAYSAQGESARALDRFALACSLDPNSPIAATYAGLEYFDLQDWANSEAHLREGLRRNPNYLPLQAAWSAWLRSQGREDDTGTSSVQVKPQDITNVLELEAFGAVYSRRGEYLKALQFYDAARMMDRRRMTSIYGINFSNFYLGRFRETDKTLTILEGLLPEDHPLPNALRIFSYFQSGLRASPEKRLEVARRARREFHHIKHHQGNHSLVALSCAAIDSMVGVSHRTEHDHDPHACFAFAAGVQEELRSGAAGVGLAPALFHELAGVIFLEQDLDLAEQQAHLALKAKPGSHMAPFTLGAAAAARGDLSQAREWLLKSHHRAPDSPTPITLLLDLRTHAPKGFLNASEAILFAERISRILPDDLEAIFLAGRVLAEAGRSDEAEALFERGRTESLQSADKDATARFESALQGNFGN